MSVIEEFKPILNYEGLYEVSNFGRIKSCTREVKSGSGFRVMQEHFITQKDDGNGYLIVNLWKDNKLKHYKVHRLVASAFISNPNGLRDVNHKDENKYNNNVENLEWTSHKANINYGTHNERSVNSRSKAVGQYDKITKELLATYKNAYIAEEITGINESSISKCCRNIRKYAGGYSWKFIN